MYAINYLNRPVLITPDEVMFHMASDANVDPRQLLQNIIIAEERIIAPAMCDAFYYEFIGKKNLKITSENQAQTLALINQSLTTQHKQTIVADDIPVGTYVNAIELVNVESYVELWNMFLWKLTAEAVDWMTTVPSWLRHTSEGQQKNNPDVIGGNGKGSASGDIKEVRYKMDVQLHDRIDPLIERMRLWICARKADFPLYTKECECDSVDGVSMLRKSDFVFGAYDEDENCECKW